MENESKNMPADDGLRDWEVNGPRYKKKKQSTEYNLSEWERFLGAERLLEKQTSFTETRKEMEKIAHYYAKK